MVVFAGEIVTRMALDLTNLSSGFKQAQSMGQSYASSMNHATESASSGFASHAKSILAAGAGLGGWIFTAKTAVDGAIGLGKALLGSSADMEQTQTAFKGLLGSGQEANKMMTNLQRFAAATPFEFPELAEDTRMLLGMGVASKDVIPWMTAIGDAAAGIGRGSEGAQQVTIALGQMQAKGKISGDEMMQLTEAGIPAWKILAQSMGLTVAQVQDLSAKGKLGQESINDLVAGMEKMYGGQMKNQATTFNGLLSTLKDNAGMALRAFAGPLFDAAKNGLQKLTDLLGSPAFQNFAAGAAKVMGDAMERIGKVIGPVAAGIGQFIGSITSGKGDMGGFASTILDLADTFLPLFLQGGQQIANFVTGSLIPAIRNLQPTFSALGNLFTSILPYVVRVIQVFMEISNTIRGVVLAAFSAFLPVIVNIVNTVAGFLVPALKFIAPYIMMAANEIGKFVKEVAALAIPIIQQFAAQLMQIVNWLKSVFIAIWPTLGPIVGAAFQTVVSVIQTAWAIISGVIKILLNVLKGDWAGAWNALKDMVAGVWEGIKGIVGNALQAIIGIIGAVAGAIWSKVTEIFGGIWTMISGVMTNIWNTITSVWNSISGFISGILNAIFGVISGIMSRIWQNIVTTFSPMVSFISGVIQIIWGIISLGWKVISTAISTALNTIWNGVTFVWNQISAAISIAMGVIRNTITIAWNSISGFIGAIMSAIRNTISIAWNIIWGTISGAMSRIWGTVTTVWNTIKNGISGAHNTISGIISGAWNTIWGTISRFVNNIWNTVTSTFNRIRDTVGGIFRGMMNNIIGWLNPGLKSLSDFVNFFIGGINKVSNIFIKRNLIDPVPAWHINPLALGTDEFEGGLAMVGERGRELVILPPKTKVYSNKETEQVMRAGMPVPMASLAQGTVGNTGGIGDFFSNLGTFVHDSLNNMVSGIMSNVFNNAPGLGIFASIAAALLKTVAGWLGQWMKDNQSAIAPAVTSGVHVGTLPMLQQGVFVLPPWLTYAGHHGMDFQFGEGTPVPEVIGGLVSPHTGWYPWGGEVDILIDRIAGMWERYLHMSRILVTAGQRVNRGQLVGLSGGGTPAEGLGTWSNGPHLHYQTDWGDYGAWVWPLTVWSSLGIFKPWGKGGIINEKILGMGTRSGQPYMLGEGGSETITPAYQQSRMIELLERIERVLTGNGPISEWTVQQALGKLLANGVRI